VPQRIIFHLVLFQKLALVVNPENELLLNSFIRSLRYVHQWKKLWTKLSKLVKDESSKAVACQRTEGAHTQGCHIFLGKKPKREEIYIMSINYAKGP
jgi:hypothetical protein